MQPGEQRQPPRTASGERDLDEVLQSLEAELRAEAETRTRPERDPQR